MDDTGLEEGEIPADDPAQATASLPPPGGAAGSVQSDAAMARDEPHLEKVAPGASHAQEAGEVGTDPPLPPGWKQHWSRTKNKPYYRYSATGETTWSRPTKTKLAFGTAPPFPGRRGDEDSVMKELGVDLKSHAEVETRVIERLEAAAKQREEEKEKEEMLKREAKIKQLEVNIDAIKKKLALPAYASSFQQAALKEQLKELQDKLSGIREEIERAAQHAFAMKDQGEQGGRSDEAGLLAGAAQETERQRMIRTGLITPFDGSAGVERARVGSKVNRVAQLSQVSVKGAVSQASSPALKAPQSFTPPTNAKKSKKLNPTRQRLSQKLSDVGHVVERKRSKVSQSKDGVVDDGDDLAFQARLNEQTRAKLTKKRQEEGRPVFSSDEDDLYLGAESHCGSSARRQSAGEEAVSHAGSTGAAGQRAATKKANRRRKKRRSESDEESNSDSDWLPEQPNSDAAGEDLRDDDYSDEFSGEEVDTGASGAEEEDNDSSLEDDGEVEEFDGGFKIPICIYHKLYPYQRTGVKWMWELHCQEAGGIIGDEMGLGKTIQIVAYLAGLHRSGLLNEPVILLCPATIMRQWVREFQKWYPAMRVVILHSSGSSLDTPQQLVKSLVKSGGVMVTTYESMRRNAKLLTQQRWSYAVLDEGHKIRNPDADVTQSVKALDTPHRLLLSGSPVQNKLVELWSLFDFIFPGRLGTLPVFQTHFEIPIAAGGFANATSFQVQTAYKCALELRELIDPYLLRRLKSDVAIQLPEKQEQVLFCRLTRQQRKMYENALSSPEVTRAMEGSCKVFGALTLLRKICNHPDLQHVNILEKPASYGCPSKSTKMQLLGKILPLWRDQGHRVLLFSQTKQMLDILEKFIQQLCMTYRRMDGDSNIKSRMAKIDEFNGNAKIFCFLLTTRVGGLGVNLTGANRVIIYDPDWNPSTDLQARERSWRIGQKRDVVIYRLLVSGTIEEKIYHRQIFKQFLTNKVLKDPRQRRFFKNKDLMDLFTLGDDHGGGTETGDLFGDVADEMLAEDQSDDESYFSARARDQVSDAGARERSRRGDSEEPATDKRGSQGESSGSGKDAQKSAHQSGPRDQVTSVVDGIALPGVEVRGHREEKEASSAEEKKSETDLLKRLLLSNSINSAISHDQIMADNRVTGDNVTQQESEKIARKAAAALRLSAQQRMADPVNVPTWTGRAGIGGAPAVVREREAAGARVGSTKPRFGNVTRSAIPVAKIVGSLDGPVLKYDAPDAGTKKTVDDEMAREHGFGGAATCGVVGASSVNPANSKELLDALRIRGIIDGLGTGADQPESNEDWALMMMRDLSGFLSRRHKPPTTGEILDVYRDSVPAHRQELFRTCLKQVADVEKRDGRPGRWHVRRAFRTVAQAQNPGASSQLQARRGIQREVGGADEHAQCSSSSGRGTRLGEGRRGGETGAEKRKRNKAVETVCVVAHAFGGESSSGSKKRRPEHDSLRNAVGGSNRASAALSNACQTLQAAGSVVKKEPGCSESVSFRTKSSASEPLSHAPADAKHARVLGKTWAEEADIARSDSVGECRMPAKVKQEVADPELEAAIAASLKLNYRQVHIRLQADTLPCLRICACTSANSYR
jgi:DNA excision repair protein ERCC-6